MTGTEKLPVESKKRVSKIPRWAGIAILTVCLLFSVWYGTEKEVKAGEKKLSAVFTDGVDGDGFSIKNDLETTASEAYNLATIAKKALGEDDASAVSVTANVEKLRNAISGGEVSEIHDCYIALFNSVEELYANYKAAGDDESRVKLALQCYTEIKSRNSTISGDGYNDAVREYNEKLDSFPAKLIINLCGYQKGQLFE